MSHERLAASLEAFLFVHGDAVTTAELSRIMETGEGEIEAALQVLRKKYEGPASGIMVRESGAGWALSTKKEYDAWLSTVEGKPQSLSPAALETLAVIVCREPVTRAEIEKVRGVSAGRILSVLTEKGLVEERGRLDVPGRPILYGTTKQFLQCAGIADVSELRTAWEEGLKKEGALF